MLEKEIIQIVNQDIDWSSFRKKFFNYDQINLNVANLGSPLTADIISKEIKDQILVNPLKQYEIGRYYYNQSAKLAKELFFIGDDFNLEISLSSSQIASIISNGFQKRLKVLTTTQEHEGGVSAFHNTHDCYDVSAEDLLKEDTYSGIKPDIILFSHALYKSGQILPIKKIYDIAKKCSPNTIVILDAAQTLGVYPIDMNICDITFSSTHKWLHGPRGLGIVCYKKNYKVSNKIFYGSQIHHDKNLFSLSGGQDFLKYLELYFILKTYKVIALPKVTERLQKLKSIFKDKMIFYNIDFLDYNSCHDGILCISSDPKIIYSKYLKLQEEGIHVKCFAEDGLFRVSFPFYESEKRIENSAKKVGDIICGKN